MNWKALIAVLLVIGIAGILITTSIGSQYFGSFQGIVGSFTKQAPSGSGFQIIFTTSPTTFYGQNFQVSNSTITITGMYDYFKVGNQMIDLTSGHDTTITITNFKGTVSVTAEGKLSLSATSGNYQIGDYSVTLTKPDTITTSVLPTEVSLTNLSLNKITFKTVSGELDRISGNNADVVHLNNNNFELDNFNGEWQITSAGSAILNGMVTSAKGDTFTFS